MLHDLVRLRPVPPGQHRVALRAGLGATVASAGSGPWPLVRIAVRQGLLPGQ
jgi:hypothetical protein